MTRKIEKGQSILKKGSLKIEEEIEPMKQTRIVEARRTPIQLQDGRGTPKLLAKCRGRNRGNRANRRVRKIEED
jgi:hypothetical protein